MTPHRGPDLPRLPARCVRAIGRRASDSDDESSAAARIPIPTRSASSPRRSQLPNARRSSSAATSTGAERGPSCARLPNSCACRASSTGSAAARSPADHELAFLRTRGLLKQRADLVVVLGTPLDFRLGFGRFGNARVAHVVDAALAGRHARGGRDRRRRLAQVLRLARRLHRCPRRSRRLDRRAARCRVQRPRCGPDVAARLRSTRRSGHRGSTASWPSGLPATLS